MALGEWAKNANDDVSFIEAWACISGKVYLEVFCKLDLLSKRILNALLSEQEPSLALLVQV